MSIYHAMRSRVSHIPCKRGSLEMDLMFFARFLSSSACSSRPADPQCAFLRYCFACSEPRRAIHPRSKPEASNVLATRCSPRASSPLLRIGRQGSANVPRVFEITPRRAPRRVARNPGAVFGHDLLACSQGSHGQKPRRVFWSNHLWFATAGSMLAGFLGATRSRCCLRGNIVLAVQLNRLCIELRVATNDNRTSTRLLQGGSVFAKTET